MTEQLGFDFEEPPEPPMPPRPSFIQPKKTKEVAKEAMERAERLSGDDWKIEMQQAIRAVAERMEYFTADHVWEELGQVGNGDRDDGSGLGPMLQMACRSGIIRKSDIQPSQRPVTHGKPITLWRSLIFKNDGGNP